MRLIVDTSLLIDASRGNPSTQSYLERHRTQIILPAIVITELYAGVREDEERAALQLLEDSYPIISMSLSIARQAGLYLRQYRPSHGLGLGDAIIAATAKVQKARLVSLNEKHFRMFSFFETISA